MVLLRSGLSFCLPIALLNYYNLQVLQLLRVCIRITGRHGLFRWRFRTSDKVFVRHRYRTSSFEPTGSYRMDYEAVLQAGSAAVVLLQNNHQICSVGFSTVTEVSPPFP